MSSHKSEFERVITNLTLPINGQFPRPWMTDLTDPLDATVFIVGKNQAKTYPETRLDHARHLNGLFNRSGETARRIYDEITAGKRSPTRANTDNLRGLLNAAGVTRILETNVVCYSTPMSGDLHRRQHAGGAAKGTEIFLALLHFIKPKVLIAHGAGTHDALAKVLGVSLPIAPTLLTDPQSATVKDMTVFTIPSLAPPEWNKWCTWAPEFLARVATAVGPLA